MCLPVIALINIVSRLPRCLFLNLKFDHIQFKEILNSILAI
jgi:hypothetical protein